MTPLFGQRLISTHEAGMIGVTLVMLGFLYLFFRGSRLGLAMRAAAANRIPRGSSRPRRLDDRARLGMSAAIGAVAGMLIARSCFSSRT